MEKRKDETESDANLISMMAEIEKTPESFKDKLRNEYLCVLLVLIGFFASRSTTIRTHVFIFVSRWEDQQ